MNFRTIKPSISWKQEHCRQQGHGPAGSLSVFSSVRLSDGTEVRQCLELAARKSGKVKSMLTEIYTFLQMMSLSEVPCIFQKDNLIPHTSSTRTAWLHSRRVWLLNFPACSVWEHLEHQESKNRTKTSQGCWELGSSIRQEWENCPLPEVEWILHSGKHGPIPTFWDVWLH